MLRIEAMKSEALLIKIISEKRFFSKNRKRLGKKDLPPDYRTARSGDIPPGSNDTI